MNPETVGIARRRSNRLAALLAFSLLAAPALASERIGLVKTFVPEAAVIRGGVESKLGIGDEIHEGDTLITRSGGALGVIFSDGAVLTLGADSRLIIEDFLFEPAEKNVSFVTRILKGSLAFISGAIGRIAPQAVKFETPDASLGLRGTKILVEVK